MNIKKLMMGAGLALSLAGAAFSHGATEILDQVVAIVDDDVVMASELRSRLSTVTANLEAREVELPPEDELIRQTLDRLILENIQLQMGTRVGVRISDAQLNAAVQRIAAGNGMSLEQFRAAMEGEGRSYVTMREEIRREMILQRVQSGNVNQRIQITPQEVKNFLGTEEGRKLAQPEYRMLHALLAIPPGVEPAEFDRAQTYVDGLVSKIRGGEPFEKVISTGGLYRFSGGDLGWRSQDDLPSLFADVAPTLTEGETSDAIRSESGIHLVHMVSTRGTAQVQAQTHVRHILIKPSEIMSDGQANGLATELRQRAKGGEDFAELAKEYSEDIGSAQEGGDLGWTTSGQMVKEFEQQMAKTEVGDISEPVRSQFGWHIIEVLERRQEDMTEQAVRNKAMDHLHQRKYQEELEAWLRRIRDEAFVDIK